MMITLATTHRCLCFSVRQNARIVSLTTQNSLRFQHRHASPMRWENLPTLFSHTPSCNEGSDISGGVAFSTTSYNIKGRPQENKVKNRSSHKDPTLYRADRVLANRGWGTRSSCFDLLKQKRVFIKKSTTDSIVEPVSDDEDDMPNMIRIMGPKERIPMDASLWVDGKIEVPGPPPLLRVYHKPKWVLSVMADPHGRKNLESLSSLHLSGQLHPVGRLDYDTSGLLLFSSEGSLTQALLHPNQEIEKEYVATVVGTVNEEGLSRRLQEGVTTSMGTFPATLVETQPIPRDDVADIINNILQNLPPEYDRTRLEEKGYLFFANAEELSTVRIIVTEGKHRMVRRILANSGYPVISLKRERLGNIQLGDIEEGGYRDLTQEEESWAQSLLKKKKKKTPPPSKKKKVIEATGKLNGNRD